MPYTISRPALFGAATAIAAFGMSMMDKLVAAAATADPGDLSSLNSAIELERAGIKAYVDAAATGLVSAPVLVVAKGFMADHAAHRDALIAAVKAGGGTPSDKTAPLNYPSLKSEADILRFAMVVEEKAASTYLSVIPDLKDRNLAQVSAAILGIETMHVSVLQNALKIPSPYKTPFIT
jgi:rubrerythrin